MSDHDDALKQELLETNDEFRRLHDEHQAFERRLEELTQKTLPSQEDELEAKRIKLEKLRRKDRMELILRSHREAGVSA